MLNCANQAKCIIPELQLKRKFKVYLCSRPASGHQRLFFLLNEGFYLHPNSIMVNSTNDAELLIYLEDEFRTANECSRPADASKLVVINEVDFPFDYAFEQKKFGRTTKEGLPLPLPRWYWMMFRRSFVLRHDGHFVDYHTVHDYPDMYPMVYSLANAYTQHQFHDDNRNYEIVCTLRTGNITISNGVILTPTSRIRVLDWVVQYGAVRGITDRMVTSEVSTMTRGHIDRNYFERMFHSKIVVTVNPAHWLVFAPTTCS